MSAFPHIIEHLSEETLREVREKALQRKLDPERGELYLVFPGMGVPRYISETGVVYLEGDWLDHLDQTIRPGTLSQTLSCYAYTADKFNIPGLRSALPRRPEEATDCHRCERGSGWMNWSEPKGRCRQILCPECHGLGWIL